jgi:uncharacterized membrane protein
MTKGRLEAFSDGVLAIIITIMVLEIKVPHGTSIEALKPLTPVFISYILSFIYIAIYWNNHHHLMHSVKKIDWRVLWANMHLLFWLSLIPFASGWMGENNFEKWPVVIYGIVLLMSAIAFTILLYVLKNLHGQDTVLVQAISNDKDKKGVISSLLKAAGIGLAFVNPWIAITIFGLDAAMWLVPNKKIEKLLKNETN